jgi:hypothetical protein
MSFENEILNVVIGVVFGFLAISLFASAAVEAANSFLKLRAVNLKSGILELVNDKEFTGLAKLLYEHAYVSPLGPGVRTSDTNGAIPTTRNPAYDNRKNLPSYIEKSQFAAALLDVLKLTEQHVENIAKNRSPSEAIAAFSAKIETLENTIKDASGTVEKIECRQLKQLLNGIVARSAGQINRIEADVAEWFDSSMDRLSGGFKRRAQFYTFLVALVFAAVVNVDTIRIGTAVWEHPTIVRNLDFSKTSGGLTSLALKQKKRDENQQAGGTSSSQPAPAASPDDQGVNPVTEEDVAYIISAMTEAGLPVGWAPGHVLEVNDGHGHWAPLVSSRDELLHWPLWRSALGWFITAIAALFGAPFWFDSLQKLVRLKGSGPSPDEKTDKNAAAA